MEDTSNKHPPGSPENEASSAPAAALQEGLRKGQCIRPATLPSRTVCRIVRQMAAEMILLASDRIQVRRDRCRTACHVRQIAMYVCHVALGISLSDIGLAFGRDRTTVGHACGVVEDRRDDPAFDDFVSALERIATSVFSDSGAGAHE